ncbi:MAG: hypothetical protein IJM02_06710 [Clostridia bacterium]|nr:hypothetical protein [Clostridia bacterium]
MRDGLNAKTIYTGQEIYDLWAAKTPLTYNRGKIFSVEKRTTDILFIYVESNGDRLSPGVNVWSATVPLDGKDVTFDVNAKYSKTVPYDLVSQLSGGSVSQNNTKFVTGGQVYTAVSAKQDTLTFDNAPTQNSNNPVKSGGVYTALAGKQNTLTAGTGIDITNNVISATGGGGGITYDITVSGTSSSTDEPTASDLSSATMTYNTTIAEMITKITGKGTVDINGQLHYDTGDGIVKYINIDAYKYPNEVVPYAAVAYYAGLLQKPAPKVDQDGIGLTIHPTNFKANVSSHFKFYLYEDTTGTIQKIVM